jgi:hypothetical protein
MLFTVITSEIIVSRYLATSLFFSKNFMAKLKSL